MEKNTSVTERRLKVKGIRRSSIMELESEGDFALTPSMNPKSFGDILNLLPEFKTITDAIIVTTTYTTHSTSTSIDPSDDEFDSE